MAVKYKLNWELVVYKPYMVLNSGLKCISYCQRIHSFKYIYFRGSYGFATWLHFISSCHRLFLSAMCQLCVSTHLGTSQLCTSIFFKQIKRINEHIQKCIENSIEFKLDQKKLATDLKGVQGTPSLVAITLFLQIPAIHCSSAFHWSINLIGRNKTSLNLNPLRANRAEFIAIAFATWRKITYMGSLWIKYK